MEKTRQEQIAECKTLEELQALGERLGYRRGWAEHLWHARQVRENQADE